MNYLRSLLQLIPEEEIGKDGYIIFSPKVPKIVLNKSDRPHEVAEA